MDSETSYVNSKLRQLICDSAGLRPWLFIFPPKKCVQLFVSIYNNATSLEIDQRMLPFILTWTSTGLSWKRTILKWDGLSLTGSQCPCSVNQKIEVWLSPLVRVRWELKCTCLPHAGVVRRAQSLCKHYFQIDIAYPLPKGIIALHSYL